MFESGTRESAALIEGGKQELASEPAARLDYFEVVDPDTLEPVAEIAQSTLVAVAAFLGKARLIDNAVLEP
jgi:pantothenate synthetase